MLKTFAVIIRSPNQPQPVLNAITRTAARLSQADNAHFRLLRDGANHVASSNNYAPVTLQCLVAMPTSALVLELYLGPLPDKALDSLTRIRSSGKHLLGLINTVDIANGPGFAIDKQILDIYGGRIWVGLELADGAPHPC